MMIHSTCTFHLLFYIRREVVAYEVWIFFFNKMKFKYESSIKIKSNEIKLVRHSLNENIYSTLK